MSGSAILSFLFGAVFTITIILFIEYLKKPHLRLTIGQKEILSSKLITQTEGYRSHLSVDLENKALLKRFRWISRDVASHCHGYISFHLLDGQDILENTCQCAGVRVPSQYYHGLN
jgi:hypothetical protein